MLRHIICMEMKKQRQNEKKYCFFYDLEETEPVLFFDGNRMSIRGYEMERLFKWLTLVQN